MGLLVDGEWKDKWYDTEENDGHFEREKSSFRSWVTADGSAGPSGKDGFKAEPGRYHLYVSYACPWAHRALIFRALKGLEEMIDISVVNWYMGENGWSFKPGPGVVLDPIHHAEFLREVYLQADSNYTGRVTVPILWDKETQTIVNNESSEVIRMFNSAFDPVGAVSGDYYPEELRDRIDEINDRVYRTINNGVYKAGFATTQDAYEEAVKPLFESLDWIEEILSENRYLTGDQVTEADWRLFTTLVRFDPVYFGHFKCNLRRIVDYSNLWGYLRDLYQIPKVADTVHLDHIQHHYYESHDMVNPTRIVPVGPEIDFNLPHNRGK